MMANGYKVDDEKRRSTEFVGPRGMVWFLAQLEVEWCADHGYATKVTEHWTSAFNKMWSFSWPVPAPGWNCMGIDMQDGWILEKWVRTDE